MKEQVIIANGVSKAYAMTGWRIGFLAGPEWIIKGCSKLQGQYTSGTCSVSQKAAEAAYTLDQGAVEEMRVAFERRRNLIVKLAKEVPGLEVNMPQVPFISSLSATATSARAMVRRPSTTLQISQCTFWRRLT